MIIPMNSTINPNNWLSTSDLSLAAALSVAGFVIDRMHRMERHPQDNEVAFCFYKTDALKDAVDQYRNGEMRVDSEKFFSELKHLKTRIRENY